VKCKTIVLLNHVDGGHIEVGTEYEGPVAIEFVRVGAAVPTDDECAAACGLSPEELARAQRIYQRSVLGIHPEDFEAFDAGLMIGYTGRKINGRMEWAPGPNYEQLESDDDEPE
jgi:hypothetical protein